MFNLIPKVMDDQLFSLLFLLSIVAALFLLALACNWIANYIDKVFSDEKDQELKKVNRFKK